MKHDCQPIFFINKIKKNAINIFQKEMAIDNCSKNKKLVSILILYKIISEHFGGKQINLIKLIHSKNSIINNKKNLKKKNKEKTFKKPLNRNKGKLTKKGFDFWNWKNGLKKGVTWLFFKSTMWIINK